MYVIKSSSKCHELLNRGYDITSDFGALTMVAYAYPIPAILLYMRPDKSFKDKSYSCPSIWITKPVQIIENSTTIQFGNELSCFKSRCII